jgi:hypothetical protein
MLLDMFKMYTSDNVIMDYMAEQVTCAVKRLISIQNVTASNLDWSTISYDEVFSFLHSS